MQIEIYGCKVNKYYLDTWMKYFEHHGIDSNDVIIASCVVTDRAKKKWVKSILKKVKILSSSFSRQQGKIKKIYLTGCGSLDQGKKMDEEKFYHLYPELAPYRDQIVLLGESPDSYDYSLAHKKKMSTKVEEKKQRLYTRKFVVIQNGCDSFCSFCLTVQARGRHRSRSLEDIIVEIKEREDQGGQEIILTGVNLGAWGAETTTDPRMASLGRLLRAILDKTSIPRIRISSLGPEFVNEELLEVCKNIRILPYFHFSIQSFSNTVLEGMRRNYTAQYVKDIIAKFRHLDRSDNNLINIGTDIIA